MQCFILVLLVFLQLASVIPAHGEDSSEGALSAVTASNAGVEEASGERQDQLKKAQAADEAAKSKWLEAAKLISDGDYQGADEASQEAQRQEKIRDDANARANELADQVAADEGTRDQATKAFFDRIRDTDPLTGGSLLSDRTGKVMPGEEASSSTEVVDQVGDRAPSASNQATAQSAYATTPTSSDPQAADTTGSDLVHTAKPLTDSSGGNVRIGKGCPDGSTLCFVGDDAQPLPNGNRAMPNAYEYFKSKSPNTYAVSSLDEMEQIKSRYPEGTPVIGAFHGTQNGIQVGEDEVVEPGTPEADRLGRIFRGSDVALMSCSAANVQGLCSGLANDATKVTAYDKPVYMGTDGIFAQDPNTSEHVWKSGDAPIEPDEVVQPDLETHQSPEQNWTPQQQRPTYQPRVVQGTPPGIGSGSDWMLPFIISAFSNAGALASYPPSPAPDPISVSSGSSVPNSQTSQLVSTDQSGQNPQANQDTQSQGTSGFSELASSSLQAQSNDSVDANARVSSLIQSITQGTLNTTAALKQATNNLVSLSPNGGQKSQVSQLPQLTVTRVTSTLPSSSTSMTSKESILADTMKLGNNQ